MSRRETPDRREIILYRKYARKLKEWFIKENKHGLVKSKIFRFF